MTGGILLLLLSGILFGFYAAGGYGSNSHRAKGTTTARSDIRNRESSRSAPASVQQRFVYRGKPIHPALVEEFTGYLSDAAGPITVAVDLAAAHDTNEYGAPVTVNNGWISYSHSDGPGRFSYRWLGRLEDGTHVLRTAESGGGSGVFENLMLIRFTSGQGFATNAGRYDRLLMRIVGQVSLGDRSRAEVTVSPKQIVIEGSRYEQGRRLIQAEELPPNVRPVRPATNNH
jgi:hypothetical protein